MPRAYSYVRFSSLLQAKGGSLDRQEHAAEAWAKAHGYDLDNNHRDLGTSAYRGKHRTEGALSRFLAEIKAGNIPAGSVLLVESIDRLSRENYVRATNLITSIMLDGVAIITLEDGQIYSEATTSDNPSLPVILNTKIQAAHEYSTRLSHRVKHGKAKARSEKIAAKRPLTKMCPAWFRVVSDKDGIRYEVIEERVKIIRYIMEQLDNDVSKHHVARDLNSRGIQPFTRADQGLVSTRPRKLLGWTVTMITKLAHNRALIGEFQPITHTAVTRQAPVGDPVQLFDPVIDRQLFDRVQGNKKDAGRRGKHFSNLLTGLVTCWNCGGPVVYRKAAMKPAGALTCKGTPYKVQQYLMCRNSKKRFQIDGKRVCTNEGLSPYLEIEATIIDMAGKIVEADEFNKNINHDRVADKRIEEALAAKLDAETRLTNLANEFGRKPSQTMLKIMASIEIEIEQLTAEHKKLVAAGQKARQRTVARDYRELANLLEQSSAAKSEEGRYKVRERIHGILSRCRDAIVLDTTSNNITAWFGGGRLLCTKLDGHRTAHAIMGNRMVTMRQTGINNETETPPDILAQHQLLARGGDVRDMAGVLAGVILSPAPAQIVAPTYTPSSKIQIRDQQVFQQGYDDGYADLPHNAPDGSAHVRDMYETGWALGSQVRRQEAALAAE